MNGKKINIPFWYSVINAVTGFAFAEKVHTKGHNSVK